MLGQLTRGKDDTVDTTGLTTHLRWLGQGESPASYSARQILNSVERHTLPDPVIDRLTNLPRPELTGLVHKLGRHDAYDLPRRLVYALAEKFG